VNEQNKIILSIMLGAVVGGVAGFLLFTERGRRLRDELTPHIDELAREVKNLQELALHVRNTANDSWHQMEQFVGELGHQGGAWTNATQRH
jgi:gas vesicle protein